MPAKRKRPAPSEPSPQSPKKASPQVKDCMTWEQQDGIIYGVHNTTVDSASIYGFDIDQTIVNVKSGSKFPKDSGDWVFVCPEVPEKLKQLSEKGIKVAFFTNQAGIEKKRANPDVLKKKFAKIVETIGIPINVYISTGESQYRKPATGMWDLMVSHHNGDLRPNLSACRFVGDAAGRHKHWKCGAKKDWSCSDRKFAANIGVQFLTPEEFFMGEETTEQFSWGGFDPKEVKIAGQKLASRFHRETQEVVVLVGPPAAGKSTFYRRYFLPHGYAQVNRDTLGTEARCLEGLGEALAEGRSAVVDNTNPSQEARRPFIQAAKDAGVDIRCIVLDTDPKLAQHLSYVRQTATGGGTRRIPDVAYNVYKGKYRPPTAAEGFSSVETVPFRPVFDHLTVKQELFSQWTEA